MSEMKKTVRVMPLPVVHPRWENEWSEYPETIQVSFSDGKVRTYRIQIELPKPSCLLKASEMAKLFRENTHGYSPKHAKK